MGLRERSIKAVAWSAADTCGRQGIGVVISIALARLISPAEFGVVGMAAFFLALGEVFVDGGFSAALIQRKDITEADKSSVLFYNIVMGLVMCAAMFVAAPWIAAFYRQPLLTGITRLLALNIVVGAGGAVQMALFRRDLNFKTPWKIGMAATGISGVIALVMASRGYGVWSLAMQAVIASVVSTSLLWASSPWRPGRVVDTASLRSLGKFGSRLLASDLLNTGFDKIQLLIIGKAFSAADLGHYTRAYSTRQLPASLLSTIVTKVTFPVFSTIADDERRLKAAVRQSLKAVTLVTMPMMLGLAVLAGPLVEVLFGKAWLPCVPYLALLSISGAIYPLQRGEPQCHPGWWPVGPVPSGRVCEARAHRHRAGLQRLDQSYRNGLHRRVCFLSELPGERLVRTARHTVFHFRAGSGTLRGRWRLPRLPLRWPVRLRGLWPGVRWCAW